jgi:hypothetical protein
VPSVKPVTVALVVFAGTGSDVVPAVTLYPVTGSPPSSPGGLQVTINAPSRPTTDETNGASGTVAGRGTTGNDCGLAALVPPGPSADTDAEYATSLHRFPISPAELDAPTESVNGPAQPDGGVGPPDAATTVTL